MWRQWEPWRHPQQEGNMVRTVLGGIFWNSERIALSGVRLEAGKSREDLHESRGDGTRTVTPVGTRRVSSDSGLRVSQAGEKKKTRFHLPPPSS